MTDRNALALEAAQLAAQVADRDALIRWLALPYAGDPVFQMAEDVSTPGHNPVHKRRLQATWDEVIGRRQGWAGQPGQPGYWAQCQSCGTWQIVNTVEVNE